MSGGVEGGAGTLTWSGTALHASTLTRCEPPRAPNFRWERAVALGLEPPPEIPGLLARPGVSPYCLWHGRL